MPRQANQHTLRLGEHFKLGEFLVSKDYPVHARMLDPSDEVIENLFYGVGAILDPWRREHPKNKIIILSGYRDTLLNSKVGGSPVSAHLKGAADIYATDMSILYLYNSLHVDRYPWRELRVYPEMHYIHLSWNRPGLPWARKDRILLEGGRRK